MAAKTGLLDYDTALQKVLECAKPIGTTNVPLADLLGRVLAEPVTVAYPMPFFDNSAVDGYALTAEDAARTGVFTLPLSGTLRAGDDPTDVVLSAGVTMKVLTGAAIPVGAAAMVMREETREQGGNVTFDGPHPPGRNIRRKGEEFQPGAEMLPAKMPITPGVVAAIAAAGQASARVYHQPRVGILVTGDELVPPGTALQPGQIYESNAFGLVASLQAMGFPAPEVRRTADEPGETRAVLDELLRTCDVVLTSGGVSVGEFDTIKPALADLGVETIFWRLAIKPGKPVFFGRRPGGAAVFGLPGNPVAAMVTFHALARPFILRMMGLDGHPAITTARLARDLQKKPGRMEFVPCLLDNGVADPEIKRGSHMLGTLARANALALFPAEAETLRAGVEARVMPLQGMGF